MTDTEIKITPIRLATIELRIRGTAPLIQHAWSKKGRDMLRMSAAERRKIPKTERNPEEEAKAATYFTSDGTYAIPAMGVKSAMIAVAHKDLGFPKTVIRKAVRFHTSEEIPMEASDPLIREDIVRVGNQQADIRYRPEFRDWAAVIRISYDTEALNPQDLVNLVDRAGFAVGLGEWRPERDGEFGTFEVDREFGVKQV